jgi:hypothetical protein
MATLTRTELTYLDLAKEDENGEILPIVEALAQVNEIHYDAPAYEASDGTRNLSLVRLSQPAGQRRIYGQGISPSLSQSKRVDDPIEMLEDYFDMDYDQYLHAANREAALNIEDLGFINGMGLTQAQDIVYGNNGYDPAQMNGLAVRQPVALAGSCIAMGASTVKTSAYLVRWGRRTAHLIYPRGVPGLGISRRVRGEVDTQTTLPSSGLKLKPSYRIFYSMHFGLAVKDVRAIKRIMTIDSTGGAGHTGEDILKNVVKLRAKFPPVPGTDVLYCNADVKAIFDIYALTKSNACFLVNDRWGNPVTMFGTMVIRQLDAITSAE